jgi:hypothetical protein
MYDPNADLDLFVFPELPDEAVIAVNDFIEAFYNRFQNHYFDQMHRISERTSYLLSTPIGPLRWTRLPFRALTLLLGLLFQHVRACRASDVRVSDRIQSRCSTSSSCAF